MRAIQLCEDHINAFVLNRTQSVRMCRLIHMSTGPVYSVKNGSEVPRRGGRVRFYGQTESGVRLIHNHSSTNRETRISAIVLCGCGLAPILLE
ncbi:uncharacterized protein CANTADRAFT_203673 [Suhomyces tanzawaensis NRRL Y-17324]|uniref:Uncharacterized protein n=1 Tax=Suhomyces tanzawaensis NRRL Y-17324 TaxID=984487 RepID=A0A1E4SP65_9ASCO|nr:uncharacterized protein CANTADRAFT_203673 [Suhomyces tanzawaensis NRRL Y-17324]ODV81286.1 hypothetical protein CANTADRAFT_203673 [Suhomyces tanzawaensis NRRL Y-17324]